MVGRPSSGPTDLPLVLWAALGAHLSMVCVLTLFSLVFFSGGPSEPWDDRVMVFDRTASCSLAEKGMIALHFWLKPALIEI